MQSIRSTTITKQDLSSVHMPIDELNTLAEDIDSLRQEVDMLRESEARLRAILSSIPDLMWAMDLNENRTTYFNSSEFLGYACSELEAPSSMMGAVHPDDLDAVQAHWQALNGISDGKVYEVDYRLQAKSGTWEWLNSRASVIARNGDGSPSQALVTIRVVTDRKDAEQTLLQNQADVDHAYVLLLTLSQVAQVLQSAHSSQDIYAAIQEQITRLGYNITIFELDEKDNLCIAFLSYAANLIRKVEKLIGLSQQGYRLRPRQNSIYQRVLVNGEIVHVADAAKVIADSLPIKLRSLVRPSAKILDLGPSTFAPMKVNGNITGVMAITGNNITEADNPAVAAFANQAAIALYKAQLYEQVKLELIERERTEAALRKNDEQYRDLVENSQELICTHDLEGRILSTNPAGARMLGYEVSKIVGRNIREILAPETLVKFDKYIAEISEKGIASGTMLVQTHKGDIRTWEYNNSLRTDGENPIVRGMARDITDRMLVETALISSEARYRGIFNGVRDGILVESLTGEILDANQGACEMYGYTREELLTKTVRDLVPVEHPIVWLSEDESQECSSQPVRTINVRADGERFLIELSGRLQTINEKRVQLVVVRDISEREKIEQQMHLQAIALEAAANAMVIVDRAGVIRWVNPAFTRLTGYTANEAIGRNPRLLKSSLNTLGTYKNLWQTILSGQVWYGELVNRRKDGSLYTEEQTITPVLDGNGEITHFVGIKQDISERKQAEMAIQHYNDKLSIVVDIEHALAAHLDQETIYKHLNQGIYRLFPDIATILISSFDTERKVTRVLFGTQENEPIDVSTLPELPLDLNEEGTQSRVIRSRQPLIINTDLQKYFRKNISSVQCSKDDGESQSVLCVPMLAHDQVLGVIQLQSYSHNRFTGDDIKTLTLIANTAAASIKNAKLYEIAQKEIIERQITEITLQRRAEELSALHETMQDLVGEQELPVLLRKTSERAAKLLHAVSAGIYLYDNHNNELVVHISTDPCIPIGMRLGLGEGMAGRVAQTRQPLLVDDYRTWDGSSKKYQGTQVSAVLEVPMVYSNELVGVLVVHELGNTDRRFTNDDARLLSLFATQIAGAVRNARLFEEEQNRRREAETLRYTTTALASSLDLDQVLDLLLDSLARVLHFESAAVFLHENGHLRGMAGRGFRDNGRVVNQIFSSGTALFQRILNERLPVILPDAQKDPRFSGWAGTEYVRGWMGVPLIVRGKVIGYLTIDSPEVNAFNESHANQVAVYANQAAVAIENARLYKNALTRNDELQILAEISAALRSTYSWSDMLSTLLDQILLLSPVNGVAIALRDQTSEEIIIELARGDWDHWTGTRLPPGVGLSSQVVETGKAFISNNALSESSIADTELIRDLHAVACLPLIVKEKTIGALWVGHPDSISPDDIHLFIAITEMAASAIHRSALNELTEKQLERLAALRTIDNTINSVMDKQKTFDVLLTQILAQLQVDAGAILLVNAKNQTLEYVAGKGFLTEGIAQSCLKIGEGVPGRVASSRDIIHIENLGSSEQCSRKTLLRDEQFVAYYGVPLIAKGVVNGVLELFHREHIVSNDDWQGFSETLAGQAAIAIDNAGLFESLQRTNQELAQAYDATIEGWSRAMDLRDEETEGHTRRVTALTMKLALAMGFDDQELVHIRRGALLHDIGKIGVSDHILLKPGKLTDDEWIIMKKHPQFAYDMLESIEYLRPALEIPHYHHEKWDGNGYPHGLMGEQIPLAARMFAIIDVYDALTSDRPYRKAWSREQAITHIKEESGHHFDPKIVPMFLKVLGEESVRMLPSGKKGIRKNKYR